MDGNPKAVPQPEGQQCDLTMPHCGGLDVAAIDLARLGASDTFSRSRPRPNNKPNDQCRYTSRQTEVSFSDQIPVRNLLWLRWHRVHPEDGRVYFRHFNLRVKKGREINQPAQANRAEDCTYSFHVMVSGADWRLEQCFNTRWLLILYG